MLVSMRKTTKGGFLGQVIIACIVIIIVLGILYFVKLAITSTNGPVATSTQVVATTTPVVKAQDVGIKDVDNGTYKVWGEIVTMVDGRFKRGTTPAKDRNYINSSVSLYAIGDINGDGHDDALVQTATSLGNDFDYELHAMTKMGDVASTTLLKIPVATGDVRTVDDIQIGSKGIITLSLSIVPPNGASCCPTIHATNKYHFNGTALELVATSTAK